MACDLCGKTGKPIHNLVSNYQTDEIKQVCSDCEKELSGHIWNVQKMQMKMLHGFVKSFMINKKAEILGNLPRVSK